MRARIYIGYCLGFLFMLALLYVLASQLGEDPRTIPSAQIGQQVSKRVLPILDQPHRKSVQQALKGQAGFVHFWATWCMTCQAEQPELMAHVQSIHIPWVGVVFKDNPMHVRQWLRRLGNPYQVVLLDANGALAMDMGVYGTPETFLIDTQGHIVLRHTGLISDFVWRETLLPRWKALLRVPQKRESRHV